MSKMYTYDMNNSYSSMNSARNKRLEEYEEDKTLLGEVFADDSTCGNTEFTFGTTQTELGFRKYLDSTPSIDLDGNSSLEHSMFSECPSAASMSLGSFETSEGSVNSLSKNQSSNQIEQGSGSSGTAMISGGSNDYYMPINSIDEGTEGSVVSSGGIVAECQSNVTSPARTANLLQMSPRDTLPRHKYRKQEHLLNKQSITSEPTLLSRRKDPLEGSSTDTQTNPLDMTLFWDTKDNIDDDICEDRHQKSTPMRVKERFNWSGLWCRSFCEAYSFVDCAGQPTGTTNKSNK